MRISIRFGTANSFSILIVIADPVFITGILSRSGWAGGWGYCALDSRVRGNDRRGLGRA